METTHARKDPVPKCGIPYRLGTLAPKHARFALLYWGNVIFVTSKVAAETAQGGLDYYRAEDSRIISIQEYRRRK